MVNQVVLIGRLTRDIELKMGSNNREVASFTIAVNRNFKNANGEYDADFINCVAFGNQAKFMDNYLSKGRLISVVGRINTRNYENTMGQRVYVTEVIAEQISPLDSRREATEINNVDPYEVYEQNYVQPQKEETISPYDFMDIDEIDDSDLPF